VGVVEDGVLDRADAGARSRGMAVPAEHHQVSAGGIAGEHARGMPPDDVLADPHLRVLAVPLLERGGQMAASLGRDLRRVRRPQRPGRAGGLRRGGKPVPGVDGDQVRAAQRRLLERERQRSGDILRVADLLLSVRQPAGWTR